MLGDEPLRRFALLRQEEASAIELTLVQRCGGLCGVALFRELLLRVVALLLHHAHRVALTLEDLLEELHFRPRQLRTRVVGL
tara:strand:- start:1505 stop:1750 length:246 start_codon:yes stop_codon:yes gene_type:complete